MSNPVDDYELAKDEYLKLKEKEYTFEKNGRFGKLINGNIVEIISYTEASYTEEQELYFRNEDGSLSFLYLSDFEEFDIHDSFLLDNPIKFGDMVELKDIPTSIFLNFELHQQETYDLFLGQIGLVTEVIEELQKVFIAFKRDVVEMPIHLIEKLFIREIW